MACCVVKAGELRHAVTISSQVRTANTYGSDDITWTTFATVRAKIQQMSAGERFAHQRLEASSSHKFTFRYISGVLETMKLTYNGVDYNIKGIENVDEENRWLIVTAEKGVVQ